MQFLFTPTQMDAFPLENGNAFSRLLDRYPHFSITIGRICLIFIRNHGFAAETTQFRLLLELVRVRVSYTVCFMSHLPL